jgi:hypothetical protein
VKQSECDLTHITVCQHKCRASNVISLSKDAADTAGRLASPAILRYVDWLIFTEVSKERYAFVFRVRQSLTVD